MSEYENFKKYIKEKAGIEIEVLSDEESYALGGLKFDDNGICPDCSAKKTYFVLFPHGKSAVAYISGAGQDEEKLALLIIEIAKNFFAKGEINKTDFIKSLLFGEMTASQIGRYSVKFSIPKYPAFVMLITYPEGNAEDVKNVFINYDGDGSDVFVPLSLSECAVVKFCDKSSEDYRSQSEYAEFLRQTVYEETGIPISIYIGGKVDKIADIVNSFVQAKTAKGFDNGSTSLGEIHSYKEYALMGLIEEIPKSKLKDYLALLTDENSKEIFSDKEMVATAEEFLNNSLNVSETARVLYLHRNTLIYRLDKIEKATGLNIRKFSDAVTFRLITILNKIDKG